MSVLLKATNSLLGRDSLFCLDFHSGWFKNREEIPDLKGLYSICSIICSEDFRIGVTRRSIQPSTNLLRLLQASLFVFIHVLSSEIDFCLRLNNFRLIYLVISSAFSLVRTRTFPLCFSLPPTHYLALLLFLFLQQKK